MPISRADGDAVDRRRPGWFELFFDLVVAAAIVYGSHLFAQEPSWALGAWMAVTLGVLVFLWLLTSLHHNLVPGDDAVRWLLVLVEMLAMIVATLAEGRDGGLSDRTGLAALATALACLAVLYRRRAPRAVPLPGPVARVVWRALASGAVVLAIAAALPESDATDRVVPLLLAAGLLIAVVPVITVGIARVLSEANPSREHLAERMGQLVMIVLGESFVSLVLRLGDLPVIPRPVLLVVTFAVVFAIWVVYFTTVLPGGVPGPPGRLRIWLGASWLLMLGGSGAAAGLAALTVDVGPASAGGRGAPLSLLYVMVAVAVLSALPRGTRAPWQHAAACAVLAGLVVLAYALPADQAWWATLAAAAVVVLDAGISVRRAGVLSPARSRDSGP